MGFVVSYLYALITPTIHMDWSCVVIDGEFYSNPGDGLENWAGRGDGFDGGMHMYV